MASPASATPPCAVCSKPAPLKCGRCKSLYYCNTECQKKDFGIHKIICKIYSEFDMSTWPSPNHHRAFVFPEAPANSSTIPAQDIKMKPKLVWIKSRYWEKDECYVQDSKQISDAMRTPSYIMKQPVGFLDNKQEPTSRDRFMMLWCDENFQIAPTSRNPIIDKLVPGTKWRGPVLIEAGYGSWAAPTKFCDMEVRDMKRILKFFKTFPLYGPRFPTGICSEIRSGSSLR